MRDIVITSSVLISAILGIRYLTKGRLNPILQYAFWLPVVLRLILPFPLWSSQISMLNYIPPVQTKEDVSGNYDTDGNAQTGDQLTNMAQAEMQAANVTWTDQSQPNAGAVDGLSGKSKMQSNSTNNEREIPSDEIIGRTGKADVSAVGIVSRALPFIWIAGILLVGGYMLFYQMKWKQYLKRNRKPFRVTGSNGKYRGRVSVYTVEGLPSPCLSGNCIYLTKEMASDEKKLMHILAHEYCHYKHLDFVWVIVRCILCAVYWFHPLVWAAAYASKQDSELACDAAALKLLGEKERISYGKTLLQLVVPDDTCDKRRVGIASTMSGKEKGIKERISMITGKRKCIMAVSVIVVIFVAVFIAITFSGTVKQQNKETITDDLDAGNEQVPDDMSKTDEMQENLQNMGTTTDNAQNADTETDAAKAAQEVLEAEREAAAAEAEQETAVAEAEQKAREEAVLAKLDSYDAYISEVGSREGVYGITNAKDPSDYLQAFFDNGEDALEEGMYLLETRKGSDSSDIKIYGMYTKEYGCEGITILIADDANKFDVPWFMPYIYGADGELRLYGSAEDGMPRSFAFQLCSISSESDCSEIYDYYLCDRYDTGTITLNKFKAEDYLAQMNKRISFQIKPSESRIDVYDNGALIGSLNVPASSEAMQKIDEVILDGRMVSWDLGGENVLPELRTAVGLKMHTDSGEEKIWYDGMAPLCFSVEYGNFGERDFTLGQAGIATEYRVRMNVLSDEPQTLDEFLKLFSEDSLYEPFHDEKDHYDVEVIYSNPCPSYARISDAFGTRTHPITGEVKMHNGIDLAAEQGADILAAADGSVYKVGYDSSLGNYVALYHVLSGEYTYYACCDKILVSEGEEVTSGQKIATVGSTGQSTGPHLHFALSRDGEYVEPVFE